jgi:hypothetical protein
MNYKLGTSLNLLLTAINAVGFGFTGSVVTFALHKNTLNLNRPVFSKEFTSHTSNSETLLAFGSNEIVIPKDTYWASIKIVNGSANTTIKTFKFKVGLFTDDLLNEDYNISIGSNNSAINFEIQGAIINQTGLAAPPNYISKEALNNLVKGNLVYVDAVNGKIDKTIATSVNSTKYIGLAQESINTGFVGKVQLEGLLELTDWTAIVGTTQLTPGSKYFLSETLAGCMSLAPPNTGWQVTAGTAISSTQFLLQSIITIKK